MSFDLYNEESQEQLSSMNPMKEAPVGFFDNYFEGSGRVLMQSSAKLASGVDLLGAVGPIIQDKITGGYAATDQYFKEHDEVWGNAVDHWVPKPQEIGTAANITGNLLGGLQQLLINPSLLVIGAQTSNTEELVKQGVDSTKAIGVGAVQGIGAGLGIWMPIIGNTLTQRVLAGGVGANVVQGVATRGISGEILEGTAAEGNFKAFDSTSMTLDVLMGAAFGGYAHINPAMRAQGAEFQEKFTKLVGKLKPSEIDAIITLKQAEHINSTSLPGTPKDMSDINSHVQRLRQAIDDLANDKPVSVEELPKPEYVPDPVKVAEAENVSKTMQAEAEKLVNEAYPENRRSTETERRMRYESMNPEERLQELISHDRRLYRSQLTGTKNKLALESAQELPIKVFADIDGLKTLNDTIGHDAGDAAIKAMAKQVEKVTQEVYHISGDEFKQQFHTVEEAKQLMDLARDRFMEEGFYYTDANGNQVHKKGVGFSYGIGKDFKSAEANQYLDKADRKARGLRFDRVDAPAKGPEEIGRNAWNDSGAAEKIPGRSPDATTTGRSAETLVKLAEIPGKTTEPVDPLHAEAARFAQENQDLPITIGKDSDGNDITTTARQMMEEADNVVAKAKQDATLFEVAAGCILGAL